MPVSVGTNFMLVSILAHELGHAAAVSRYGGSRVILDLPFIVDAPALRRCFRIWRFPRKHRMVGRLGGVYFQTTDFSLFALAGTRTLRPEYFIACR